MVHFPPEEAKNLNSSSFLIGKKALVLHKTCGGFFGGGSNFFNNKNLKIKFRLSSPCFIFKRIKI